MTISSRHPDALLVRIPVFAKNGTDVRSPSVYFRAGQALSSRHAGPRSGISVLRNGKERFFVAELGALFFVEDSGA